MRKKMISLALVLSATLMAGAETLDGFLYEKVSFKVDLLERSEHPCPSGCPAVEVAEYARGIHVEEMDVDASCVYVQFKSAVRPPSRSDVSLDGGMMVVGEVVYVSIERDALAVVPEVTVDVHVAEVGIVEGEVVHLEVSVHHGTL